MLAGVAELADAIDSKSIGRKPLWVRFPPPVAISLRALLLAVLVPAAAFAAPAARKCANGREPVLSGDAFAPVDCSTFTARALGLPGPSVEPGSGPATDLKTLTGRWKGAFSVGVGRWEADATVKKSWFGGRATVVLRLVERQFVDTVVDTLALKPVKGLPGAYDATWTSDRLPGTVLKGKAVLAGSGFGLSLENGAVHRLEWTRDGGVLRLTAWSSVPHGPVQRVTADLVRQ